MVMNPQNFTKSFTSSQLILALLYAKIAHCYADTMARSSSG